ncbi:MAG TPA: hypothetical protein VEO00_05625 [Actinomycetota bacterium]|nr:hypothetical protein [Actinomycetota bacterium]
MRPPLVTAAAVLLIIGGALGILGGLLLFGLSGIGGFFTLFGIIGIGVGALELYAGVQVLALKRIGWTLGIALAAISAVVSIVLVTKTAGTNIIGILIDAFIIYALYTNSSHFRN